MWRYLVGAGAGVLLVAGGVLAWQNVAVARHGATAAQAALARPAAVEAGAPADDPVPEPPAASEKTREQKRFSRYDHDHDGQVGRDEFLAARRKNFAKLDTNGDGRLSFEEYAAKAVSRFAAADQDRSGALTPAEFAATRQPRKAHRPANCPPARTGGEEEGG